MRSPSVAISSALLTLALVGCFPAKPARVSASSQPVAGNAQATPTLPAPSTIAAPSPATPASSPAPTSPLSAPRLSTRDISGIRFEGVSFDSRTHRLIVKDQLNGPGSLYPDAASAGKANGGLTATNAGFFTPEGAPLGLVVSQGKSSGSWNSASSLGSGVWFQSPSGTPAIARREALGRAAAVTMPELIQAGPMLIDNGKPVSGLDPAKTSARTLVLWDGGTRWWLGCTSLCTLAELSRSLATTSPAGWPVRHALNFDGGRSSDLWISGNIPGGPLTRRPIWNKPVRNFLVLLPR